MASDVLVLLSHDVAVPVVSGTSIPTHATMIQVRIRATVTPTDLFRYCDLLHDRFRPTVERTERVEITPQSIYQTIRSSVLLTLAVAGVLTVLVGYIIQISVWAATLAVWGTALVIVGVVGYAAVWWNRQ